MNLKEMESKQLVNPKTIREFMSFMRVIPGKYIMILRVKELVRPSMNPATPPKRVPLALPKRRMNG